MNTLKFTDISSSGNQKTYKFVSSKNSLVNINKTSYWSIFYIIFSKSFWLSLITSIFLPEGYPNTTTPDYLAFQFWDTVQGVSSYLRSILCVQAILEGVGVGNSEASSLSAAIQWVFKDGIGMTGGMFFAWWKSLDFGNDIKRWRMFADLMNDIGLTIEMISPLFPDYFLILLCLASIAKNICGNAAGATRIAITSHFSLANNLSDCQAKESIQETAVTIFGLAIGASVTSLLDASLRVHLFIYLTLLHIIANYIALYSLILDNINQSRASILARHFVEGYIYSISKRRYLALSPREVSNTEGIWGIKDSINITSLVHIMGEVNGHSFENIFSHTDNKCDKYLICPLENHVKIAFNKNASDMDIFFAIFHANIILYENSSRFDRKDRQSSSFEKAKKYFPTFLESLTKQEWNLKEVKFIIQSNRYEIESE